jgi:hypothetical protein
VVCLKMANCKSHLGRGQFFCLCRLAYVNIVNYCTPNLEWFSLNPALNTHLMRPSTIPYRITRGLFFVNFVNNFHNLMSQLVYYGKSFQNSFKKNQYEKF